MPGEQLRPGGRQLTRYGLQLARPLPGSQVLDVGCGNGATVAYLRRLGFAAQGVDVSAKLIQAARAKGLPCRWGNAAALPFAGQQFAAVLAECSFSVFPQQKRFLQEAWRVLQPGGKLLLSDLYQKRQQTAVELPFVSCLNGIQTKGMLQRQLARTGFVPVAWQDCTSLYHSFLAELVMTYGSMAAFWRQMLPDCGEAMIAARQTAAVSLSYYLAVWQKPVQQKRRGRGGR